MARDTEQLVVALEARIRDFERNFQRANRTANDNFNRIERRAKQSGDVLEKSLAGAASRVSSTLKTFGAGFAGGILGGLSVAGLQRIAASIGDVAKSVAMIGSNAKMAGLTTKAFQELSYVAEQNRISVDALADGMKELNLRADEWITTGGGSAAEAFQRLGYTADELKVKLKDPSDLLVDIIARMEQLDTAARIRIADELFGGQAGERFVELLDRGADGIRTMIREANEFGLVLSDDVIAKADEIDRKFNLISRTIGTRMKGAIVSATGDLLAFLDRMRDVEEQQSNTLGNRLSEIGMRRMEIENEILKLRGDRETTIGGTLFGPAFDKQIETLERESAELHETEKRILDILDERTRQAGAEAAEAVPDITKLNTAIQGTKPATDTAAKGMQSYADAIRALKREIPELAEEVAMLDARAKIDTAYRAAVQNARSIGEANQAYALRQQALASIGKEVPGNGGTVTDTGDDAKRKAEEQIAAYADIIAGAQEFITYARQEQAALGMSADAAAAFRYEQDMLNQARREGLELTADQRSEIATYAQGMAQAEKATQQFARSQEDAAEISRMFGEQAIDALMGIADGSMTAMDALRQLLRTLVRMLMQAVFLGEGPLAGALKGTGGLFGSLGKAIAPASSPSASSPVKSISTPATAVAEQTFAAPLGSVDRAPLAPVQETVEGLRGTLETAFAPVTDAAAPIEKALASLQYTNQGATRNMKLTPSLEAKIREAVGAVYGPDATAKIYSGGQTASRDPDLKNRPGGWTGSTRHNAGMAADAYVYDAQGRQMTGDDLAPLAQYWQAKEFGGTGLEMRGGGIHLDEHTDRARFWNYSKQGGRITPGQMDAVRAGQRGIMPEGVDMMSTGPIAADQAKAVQDQIAAQQQLAAQMAATQEAAQAMTPPIQNIGMAATQVVPNLGGVTQGMTGLLGPLMQAVPGLGQFSGAVQQLLQQLLSGMGGGGLFGSILSLKDSGQVRGPGTATSDSIPAMLSDGEFVVNAKATKKHRAALEAINSGKAIGLASGGFVGGSYANTYAPSLNINVAGSGNARQDAQLAGMIADTVDRTLKANQPRDGFRRSPYQTLTKQAQDMQHAAGRNG
ncbi:phage tail tape measure protein [Aquibium sp. LZ166]|uniref:Phage tail tape measure protein n=1 Tax=Aquibium pacificus TaxID=3153579 RepID=A0ABV3SBF4_9HYPH